MTLNLDGLKAAVDDIVKAAESVGEDVVNQESGVAQSDIDDLANALQGAHAKLSTKAEPAAAEPVVDTPGSAPPAGETPAAEGSGSAGSGAWTPETAKPDAGS